ncbi:MAG: hypothetical protein V4487_02525 [Chlamydiota bacterium]
MVLIGHGLSVAAANAQDISVESRNISMPKIYWKATEVYTPDRPLPLAADGIPIPEVDVPHTGLAQEAGVKESTHKLGSLIEMASQ